MSELRRGVSVVLAALWLALGGGCFGDGFVRKPPEKQRFVLQPMQPTRAAEASGGVLRVSRVRVSPVFDTKGFVYQTGSSTYESDFYNEFFSPPGVLLREALLGWFESCGLFAAIARTPSADADWVLETEVDQLFADRREPSAPKARLEIALRLLDARTRKVAFQKRYTASEPAADTSSAALVDAWDRALGALLAEFVRDVRPLTAKSASARTP